MVAWKFFLQNDGVSGNFTHKMATSQAGVVKVQEILKLNLTVKEIYVRVLHIHTYIHTNLYSAKNRVNESEAQNFYLTTSSLPARRFAKRPYRG